MKRNKKLQANLESIGHGLMILRRKQGYDIKAFAKANKLPLIQYWRMEKGKCNVTMSSLIKILNIHKITLRQFFIKYGNKS